MRPQLLATDIRYCSPCIKGPAATFQNQQYGNNRRVHNTFVKGKAGFRCTVCGKETS